MENLFPIGFISVIIALLTTIILSVVYRKKTKVDKGFTFIYYKLSYRRRMIRTLTSLPLVLLAVFIIYYYANWNMFVNVIFGLLVFVSVLFQFLYNMYMWKKESKTIS